MQTSSQPLKTDRSILGLIGLVVVLILLACTSDAQRIREANEAAQSSQGKTPSDSGSAATTRSEPSSTSIPRSTVIDIFDVRDGDCLVATLPEIEEFERIEIVPCTGKWDARAVSSFVVESNEDFPGDSLFSQNAIDRCDRRYSYLLLPTRESWELGDRTVSCIQASYGMEATKLDQLDRMVNPMTLKDGECINEVPEYQFFVVELVNCLDDSEFRVLNTFVVIPDGPFPGDDYIDTQASSNCAREYDFFYAPSAESWQLGNRRVTCLMSR